MLGQTTLNLISVILEKYHGVPENGGFFWLVDQALGERRSLRNDICEWLDADTEDYNWDIPESGFTVGQIRDYLIDQIDHQFEDHPVEDPVEEEKQKEANKIPAEILRLAMLSARLEHKRGLVAGHDEWFDECDHVNCKLVNKLTEQQEQKQNKQNEQNVLPIGEKVLFD